MNNILSLSKQAIKAARNQDWDLAVEINEQILQDDAKNINALNRLALAFMQQDHPRKAKSALKKVLKIDKNNKIAQKNLQKIKNNQQTQVNFNDQQYIEEPGKAKNIELFRLTDPKTLSQLSSGEKCQLDPKSTYISIITADDETYIGAIPEEISERLIKLIKTGNTYHCCIKSVTTETCIVHVQENKVVPENQGISSFPIEKLDSSYHDNKMIDEFKVRDDIPLDIVHTDTDEETSEMDFPEDEID